MENTIIMVLYSNFEEGPGFPLLNFERGSQSPTLNFRGLLGFTFKFRGVSWVPGPKVPGSGVPVRLLHHVTHKKIITTEKVNLICTKLNVIHSLKPYQISNNNSENFFLQHFDNQPFGGVLIKIKTLKMPGKEFSLSKPAP